MSGRRASGWRRLVASPGLAAGLALSALLLSGAGTALGHSQLVSSSPGAGQEVATSPAVIRLIFSEPIEGRYTSMDLLDKNGAQILVGAGSVDPADPSALVVPITTPLPDGLYSIVWRAVSAADGHSTNGFLTFGVGSGSLPSGSGQTPADVGDIHASHSGGVGALADFAKTFGDGAGMLAFGLLFFGLLVLRPVRGRVPGGLVQVQVVALLVAAGGTALYIVASLLALPATLAGIDVGGFLATHIGTILLLRIGVAVVAALAGLGLAGLRGRRRTVVASGVLGGAAAVYLVLVAAMGHSAAATTPVPLVLDVVHLGAGGVWIAGLGSLALLTGFGAGPVREELRVLVPRFSALALASGGLLAATGLYAAWLNTHDFVGLPTSYSLNLALKIALVLAAFALGAINLFDGGRDRYPLGFARRVAVEAVLAFAVLVSTSTLTSDSPTSEGRPIPITPVATTAGTTIDAELAVQPAEPGPNQLWVGLPQAPPNGATVTIVLQRLDSSTGTSTIHLSPATAVPGVDGAAVYTASGVLVASSSEWDASVILSDAQGKELGRARFDYAFDADSLISGGQLPLLDPALLIGILLLGGGLLGFAFWLGGGGPPLVEAGLGRRTLAVGSVLGSALGVLVLIGPR
ncbi:MAG TPA: copper resistance protein CopC [Candidatus Sulfotelmatobacter sp.]|nr:copper resistance protein CopC [Candidatus Sulfotelmatobacter sp.]